VIARLVQHVAYRAAIASVALIAARVAPHRPHLAVHLVSGMGWTIGLGWAILVTTWALRGRGPGARLLSFEAGMPAGGFWLPVAVASASERIDAAREQQYLRERSSTP